MDQNLIPPTSHEDVIWYKAVGVYLLGLVTALLATMWNRHEKKEETDDIDYRRRADDHLRKVTELEIRIVRIEAKDVLTKSDLYEIVKEVLEEVTNRFKADHNELAKKVEDCAASINKRIDSIDRTKERG
jgi:hypothetical protein